MKTLLRQLGMVLALLACASFVSACHTVRGAGKDIEQAGKEIQKSSDKHD